MTNKFVVCVVLYDVTRTLLDPYYTRPTSKVGKITQGMQNKDKLHIRTHCLATTQKNVIRRKWTVM